MSWQTKEGAPNIWRKRKMMLKFEGQVCPFCQGKSLTQRPVCLYCGEIILAGHREIEREKKTDAGFCRSSQSI